MSRQWEQSSKRCAAASHHGMIGSHAAKTGVREASLGKGICFAIHIKGQIP